jgi:N-acetylglutamate synthase-like GNAT family acetyltransferase
MKTTVSCPLESKQTLISLLNQCFSYASPLSYSTDFAPCFAPERIKNFQVIMDAGKPIACGYMDHKELVTRAGSAKIAVIGAVAVGPEHRNKGLSKVILNRLIQLADTTDSCGTVLWSDKAEFYGRFGFMPTGTQHLYELSQIFLPATRSNDLIVAKVENQWSSDEVKDLYIKHRCRVVRTNFDWQLIDEITSCDKRALVNSDNQTLAYIAIGRGKDMDRIVHEWGGQPDALIELIRRTCEEKSNLLWLTNPYLDDPLQIFFEKYEVAPFESNMGLFRMNTHYDGPTDVTELTKSFWFWGLDSF